MRAVLWYRTVRYEMLLAAGQFLTRDNNGLSWAMAK